MSKTVKIGITIIILLAVIPVYFLFNQPIEEGGNDPTTKNVKLEQEVAKIAAIKTKEETTDTNELTSEGQDNPAAEKNEEPVKQEFSKENQETIKTSDEEEKEKEEGQKDFLVVIDPGHQRSANLGQEPVGPGALENKIKVTGGTAGVATGKPEYKLTLEASLILGKLLEKRGVKVIYTRTSHDVNMSNKERAEIANQNHADLFVRIHADGSTNRNVKGLSVLTPSDDDPYTKAIYQDSLKASQLILDETKKNPAVKVNGISFRSDLSGFNWSKVPSTLIEMGFMSNPSEDKNLSDTGYLTNLVTNISDGIINYSNRNK
ncbi:N-acetylmuramoyl-L-alanine amidase [Bacillus sp. AFS073361]|uniref:N-acetylmuramoyl-L-alanine amidase family protein n=1 Tax=Bacillus sp. AFS073361 TaxID=2033511 RepID=UPI000BFA5C98|nr:N-acetylmuramoyl-L-alanine amidase [Bacillus sp. AFS073361]PFP28951.1 N-acetylmuramoyl-L-alanine amidase [Bacillus sp. AFS073361]